MSSTQTVTTFVSQSASNSNTAVSSTVTVSCQLNNLLHVKGGGEPYVFEVSTHGSHDSSGGSTSSSFDGYNNYCRWTALDALHGTLSGPNYLFNGGWSDLSNAAFTVPAETRFIQFEVQVQGNGKIAAGPSNIGSVNAQIDYTVDVSAWVVSDICSANIDDTACTNFCSNSANYATCQAADWLPRWCAIGSHMEGATCTAACQIAASAGGTAPYQSMCTPLVAAYCTGSTLLGSSCTQYCHMTAPSPYYDCDARYLSYCSSVDNQGDPSCACALPTAVYDAYYNGLTSALPQEVKTNHTIATFFSSTNKLVQCSYPSCSENLSVQLRSQQGTSCPAQQLCLAAITYNNSGEFSISGDSTNDQKVNCTQTVGGLNAALAAGSGTGTGTAAANFFSTVLFRVGGIDVTYAHVAGIALLLIVIVLVAQPRAQPMMMAGPPSPYGGYGRYGLRGGNDATGRQHATHYKLRAAPAERAAARDHGLRSAASHAATRAPAARPRAA